LEKLPPPLIAILMVSSIAAAGSACVNTVMVAASSGLSFTCSKLTFSDFALSGISGNDIGTLDINSAGTVTVSAGPNLDSGGPENLSFTLNGLELVVGGGTATVTEKACAAEVASTGPSTGLCGGASNTVAPMGQLTVHSLDPMRHVAPGIYRSGPVLYETISAGRGNLNAFYEVFGDPLEIPEPVTLVLLGSALAFVGLIGRRRLHRD
jgi:hypothetical protein